MSNTFEVLAEIRDDVGKGASRRLRREGKVPAIVYGEGRTPVNLALDSNFIVHSADQEAFHASILELKVGDGRKQKVILRDLQRHPFKPAILHVDFQRVSDKHALRISVPLHFANEATSPAGKKAGVVVQHLITELEIEALPKDLPEYIEVDLGKLEPGERVMLSEIDLPEGVTVPALMHDEEADTAVASAIYVRESQGTGALAAEADAALEESVEPGLAGEDEDEASEEDEHGEEGEQAGDEASEDEQKSD